MGAYEATFLGGLILGLASTLHCSAMCGAISCSSLILLGPAEAHTGRFARLRHAGLVQLGRILAYAVLGLVVGLAGSAIVTPGAVGDYRVLQWVAAAALMWAGLTMAGMLPRLAPIDAVMLRLSDTFAGVLRPVTTTPAAPVALGALWGLNPCPMVYGALFMAALTPTPAGSLAVMTGFGLGTMPGVLAAGLGLAGLKAVSKGPAIQMVVGITIALVGFLSLYVPVAGNPFLCLTSP